jgi:hypothetical protein
MDQECCNRRCNYADNLIGISNARKHSSSGPTELIDIYEIRQPAGPEHFVASGGVARSLSRHRGTRSPPIYETASERY